MRALAAAALTAALSLGAAPANLTSPGASVANNPAGDGLDLQLESIEPAIVWPGDAVTVTVTVTNSSAAPIAEPLIEMWVDWRLLADRAALIDWVAAEAIAPEITHAYLALDDPLPAGESHTAEVSLNVDALGLSAGAFGPRKLSITLRDQARETPADALAQIRTFLIWDPTNEAEGNRQQVRVSLLDAVTGPPLPGTRASGALRDATAEDGRLSALLTVAQATATLADAPDSLAFAIDPALLATALAATDPQVVGWATALLEYGATTDVFALPAYDPDLAALARAELTEYSLGDILYTPVPPPWQTPEAWLGPLAWPGGDQEPDLRTLSAARSAGLTTAVIPFGMATTSGTASGLAQMHVGGGEITALIPDAPLTELLYLGTD
ncbi:MAG: DUF6049 family protein, partial [Promicromonosporaceae bacterium]|nr:DUF6049 family protein [Promicromonosporaceae bacterium]